MLQTSQDCEPHHGNRGVGSALCKAGEQHGSKSSAEHPEGPSSSSLCEEVAGFLLLHSSQLKPLCIALESCRFSSLLVFKELQRGSCDSLFQLYFYWKLENIHCHPSHLPAACLCCSQLTDPNKIPRSWGRWKEHQLREVPGTFGATCPADSLLGFLTQKLSEKLHLCTKSRNR